MQAYTMAQAQRAPVDRHQVLLPDGGALVDVGQAVRCVAAAHIAHNSVLSSTCCGRQLVPTS